MTTPIEASPRKKLPCPDCGKPMKYEGDGRYVCPDGHGEFLRPDPGDEEKRPVPPGSCSIQVWLELVQGIPPHLVPSMRDIATLPLSTYEIGPCQGHGGHGGGGEGGRMKGPARQKLDAWRRKQSPGRFIRSIRPD